MLFGGNNHAAAAPAEPPVAQQSYQNQAPSCDIQARGKQWRTLFFAALF
jgi:hypothetical protein